MKELILKDTEASSKESARVEIVETKTINTITKNQLLQDLAYLQNQKSLSITSFDKKINEINNLITQIDLVTKDVKIVEISEETK